MDRSGSLYEFRVSQRSARSLAWRPSSAQWFRDTTLSQWEWHAYGLWNQPAECQFFVHALSGILSDSASSTTLNVEPDPSRLRT